jgi:hypothetical protein
MTKPIRTKISEYREPTVPVISPEYEQYGEQVKSTNVPCLTNSIYEYIRIREFVDR